MKAAHFSERQTSHESRHGSGLLETEHVVCSSAEFSLDGPVGNVRRHHLKDLYTIFDFCCTYDPPTSPPSPSQPQVNVTEAKTKCVKQFSVNLSNGFFVTFKCVVV